MNQDIPNIDEELLVKYLLREATEHEDQQIEKWLATSEANRQHYNQLKLIWDESKKLEAVSNLDTDKAWQRFKERVAEKQEITSHPETIPLSTLRWIRIAAILVIMIGVGLYYYTNISGSKIVVTSVDQILTDTLPDGSVVILNKHSSISYARQFDTHIRRVKLVGEAFFSVTHNKKRPFIISAGEANIKVVGTMFNVKNTPGKTEVIVESGIVEVAKKEYAVKLLPHEKATVFHEQAKPVKQQNTDELYNYYRTNEFVCSSTPLWKLVDVLNDAYNVKIIITSQQVKNMQLTTTFKNESLNNILAVICETFNLNVERRGNDIYLNPVSNG